MLRRTLAGMDVLENNLIFKKTRRVLRAINLQSNPPLIYQIYPRRPWTRELANYEHPYLSPIVPDAGIGQIWTYAPYFVISIFPYVHISSISIFPPPYFLEVLATPPPWSICPPPHIFHMSIFREIWKSRKYGNMEMEKYGPYVHIGPIPTSKGVGDTNGRRIE